jgi:hypothetical protein
LELEASLAYIVRPPPPQKKEGEREGGREERSKGRRGGKKRREKRKEGRERAKEEGRKEVKQRKKNIIWFHLYVESKSVEFIEIAEW